MYEVTCFHCGHMGQIAPDRAQCQSCDQDLRLLIPSADSTRYFSARVADFVKRGESERALGEAERGLAYQPSAELYLQAAILSKRLHKFDRMREHVSAIPLEDSLRLEGEWLLRSHQEKQRSMRETKRADLRPTNGNTTTEADDVASTGYLMPRKEQKQSRFRRLMPLLILLTTVGFGWFLLDAMGIEVGAMANQLRPASSFTTVEEGSSQGADGLEEVDSSQGNTTTDPVENRENVGDLDTPSLQQTAPKELRTEPANLSIESPSPIETNVVDEEIDETDDIELTEPTPAPTPEPIETPINEIPEDLVNDEPEGSPSIASATPMVSASPPLKRFNLQRVLSDSGYNELNELSIDAHLRRRTVILNGTVEMAAQRTLIIDLVKDVTGVEDVDTAGLRIRLPKTYTVQPGDMLTSIADKLYGDSRQWSAIYEYNTDQLLSPDAIWAGMELRVPPDERLRE